MTTIIPVAELKSDYKAAEARRRLCGAFDLFVADAAIVEMLPGIIGSSFYKRRRFPVAADVSGAMRKQGAAGVAKLVTAARSCGYLYISPGSTHIAKVAREDWPAADVAKNITAAVGALAPKLPSPVRALYVMGTATQSLPLFLSDADHDLQGEEDASAEAPSLASDKKRGKPAKKAAKAASAKKAAAKPAAAKKAAAKPARATRSRPSRKK